MKNYNYIYLITNISNISLLRGFNKLMKETNSVNTIAFLIMKMYLLLV